MNASGALVACRCCGSLLSLVQIYFPLFQTHDHTLQYPKTKENTQFEPRIKLNHNIDMVT